MSQHATPEPTRWGYRRWIAATPAYEVLREVIGAGANQGVLAATRGSRTILVVAGVVWIRNASSGAVVRLAPGQSFVTEPGSAFELGTGRTGAEVLVVQPAGFDAALVRTPGTGNTLERKPSPTSRPIPLRRPQRTYEERTTEANAAQGIARPQPAVGPARAAGEVAFGFSGHGFNLAPVVPEP